MANSAVRVFGPAYQGPRGHAAFIADTTPAVEWDEEDERWYLCRIETEWQVRCHYALPGGRDDEEAVLKRATSLLASLKQREKNHAKRLAEIRAETLPLRTFGTGQGFYHAGRRCLPQIEVEPGKWDSPTAAGAVNFALAAELFMKSLIVLRFRTKPSKIHKLDKLFKELSDEDRAGVTALYSTEPLHPKIEDDIEFAKDYFDKIRYYHEHDLRGWWHDPPSRLADRLYVYAASVIPGAETHGDPYP